MKAIRRKTSGPTLAAENILKYSRAKGMSLTYLSRHLDKNEAYLQQFITRNMPSELDLYDRMRLAKLLECSLNDVTVDPDKNFLFSDSAKKLSMQPFDLMAQSSSVPLMGKPGKDGKIDFNDKDTTRRLGVPASLLAVEGAYATRMPDASMVPAIRPGATCFVNPIREPQPGDDVVVTFKDGYGIIRHFVSSSARHLEVRQFNPDKTEKIDHSIIASVHLITVSTRIEES